MRHYDIPLSMILKIIESYESGGINSAVEVSGADRSTIYKLLKRYGVNTKAAVRCSDDTRAAVVKLYEDGLSSYKIAESLGVSKTYVLYIIHSACFPVRGSGWPKGRPMKEETKEKMSQSQKARCNMPDYDGFNGYGREQADSRGYIKVLCPGHPRASKHQHYIYMHIVIAEQTLGRRLNQDEVVHHINGDKSDNRPENLKVMTRSEHIKLHERMRKEKCRKSL